ncbi:MAG TPA: FAD-dependent oxidoreductase [Terriglobia bacterium]|nr:FAD-dependent oxidoreductase [Terriglobia bacterium]
MALIETTCCIVGGGPAGMMAGFLLARAGVDVLVLEKHADFLRDFRGDTVHPSTLEIIHELGLLDDFLRRPHQKASQIKGIIGGSEITFADFSHLPVRCPFIAFMPQWDFLDFLAEHGLRLPRFRLMMNAEVTGLIEEDGRVAGVTGASPSGAFAVRTALTIGADGRSSVVRDRAGLQPIRFGAPFDVFWMKLPRREGDRRAALGRVDAGQILVMIDRGDYWQCGYVISKGAADDVRREGLSAFRERIAAIAPELADRCATLTRWEDVRLLTVQVNRLKTWFKPGLLMIGDAAHAMSPIGGVGINLAVQDAVAASNLLAGPLRRESLTAHDLRRVQNRRDWPTRITQRFQMVIQKRALARILQRTRPFRVPLIARLVNGCPILQRIPARLVGMGFRPEHIAPISGPGAN